MTFTDLDRAIAALAASQHGAFSLRQVRAAGGTTAMVRSRLRSGAWRRLDAGVYALASVAPTWRQRSLAATIGHPDARIAGVGAAVLHRFLGFENRRPRLEVLVPRGANHRSGLARVRQSDHLTDAAVDNIPVVSAAHAFFALLPTFSDHHAAKVIQAAFRAGTLTPADLLDRAVQIDRSRYPGIARIREVADGYTRTGALVETSVLELHLHEILRAPGMPAFVAEAPAPWRTTVAERVDVLLVGVRVIIEADGRTWHAQQLDAENDGRRNNLAAQHGYLVLRFGWKRIVGDPEGVRQEILDTYRAALATQVA